MKLSAKINGSFTGIVHDIEEELSRNMREAVRDAGLRLKEELRAQVRAAGLGKGLENAWRMEVYPKGNKRTLHPAALVYSKATKLHAAYNEGGVIRGKNGNYLAIPTENTPNAAWGKRKMSPGEVEQAFSDRLRFVPTRTGGMLVLSVLRGKKAGTLRQKTQRRLQQGRKAEVVVMFWLVRQSKLKKVLDIEGAAARAEARLQENVIKAAR